MTDKEDRIITVLHVAGAVIILCGIFHAFYAKFNLNDVINSSILCTVGITLIVSTNIVIRRGKSK